MMAFKEGLKVRYSNYYNGMYLVLNLGRTKEDHEAPLTFRGMEEKLRIFNKTQEVVARYGDPPQIMSCRDVSSGYACQLSRRLVKEARARSLGQEDLERRFLNGFLDDSKDRPCITAISRCDATRTRCARIMFMPN
ncbi:hypothetical protein TIFTF001_056081 [Ficus carica]|uniref:Uncharacterized protein n=1 Tax=Ficus carica TaxID=3494 RepID=A0AA88JIC7_FICCA|nr:hypothetical protein TIFTF001_056081 [Ficus carica]